MKQRSQQISARFSETRGSNNKFQDNLHYKVELSSVKKGRRKFGVTSKELENMDRIDDKVV